MTVLIIDDEEKLRKLMARFIGLEGYLILEASNLSSAEFIIKEKVPDILVCDVKLPDGNGVGFCKKIKVQYPAIEIILLTAYGNIPDGVQAIKNGAFDYLVKGDDNERIIPLLARVSEKILLQQKVMLLEERLNKKYDFNKIIGNSIPLQQAITAARKVAVTDASVLLNGETGTGKEVFAQAIHANSNRSGQPFVALNCSSFSKDLLESELFGHKAGAFTGAVKDKKGLIDEAKGGTLFLDEIGELPIDLQPKLLRFLESGAYYRVGDSKQQTADVRIIAATNRKLGQEEANGYFRSDLYYRIAVFTITIPSLRERIKDIPLLADYFLQVYTSKIPGNIKEIDEQAIAALKAHSWPGNIRELKNVIERAVILEETEKITINSLPFELQNVVESGTLPTYSLASMEKTHIHKILLHTNGNKAATAKLLQIGIATLYRKLDEYGLKDQ